MCVRSRREPMAAATMLAGTRRVAVRYDVQLEMTSLPKRFRFAGVLGTTVNHPGTSRSRGSRHGLKPGLQLADWAEASLGW